jgi:hypothetical protein
VKYRFSSEDFDFQIRMSETPGSLANQAARIANQFLEQWEKDSEKVFSDARAVQRVWRDQTVHVHGKFTIEAIIWNPNPFEEEK